MTHPPGYETTARVITMIRLDLILFALVLVVAAAGACGLRVSISEQGVSVVLCRYHPLAGSTP